MVAGRVLTEPANIPVGDYVSEGLAIVIPDACFPNMVVGDKDGHPWPYLRKNIKHNWYCDRRAPMVGFLSRDEAVLLHNLALQFRGKPGLEIGSWMGWSTCHLALAGLMLDVVDPVFAKPEHLGDVRDSLAAAGVLANVRLYGTASPEGVRDLAKLTGLKWNFIFIDGDHEFLLRLSFAGLKLESLPEATFYYRKSTSGRHLQANEFRNYESLFEHLSSAPAGDLARIIRAVSAPMLIGQGQDSASKLLTKQHVTTTDVPRSDRNESRRTAE